MLYWLLLLLFPIWGNKKYYYRLTFLSNWSSIHFLHCFSNNDHMMMKFTILKLKSTEEKVITVNSIELWLLFLKTSVVNKVQQANKRLNHLADLRGSLSNYIVLQLIWSDPTLPTIQPIFSIRQKFSPPLGPPPVQCLTFSDLVSHN